MSPNPESDVLSAIDELERDEIDDLVDAQLRQESSGYDHNLNEALCDLCGGDWHGQPQVGADSRDWISTNRRQKGCPGANATDEQREAWADRPQWPQSRGHDADYVAYDEAHLTTVSQLMAASGVPAHSQHRRDVITAHRAYLNRWATSDRRRPPDHFTLRNDEQRRLVVEAARRHNRLDPITTSRLAIDRINYAAARLRQGYPHGAAVAGLNAVEVQILAERFGPRGELPAVDLCQKCWHPVSTHGGLRGCRCVFLPDSPVIWTLGDHDARPLRPQCCDCTEFKPGVWNVDRIGTRLRRREPQWPGQVTFELTVRFENCGAPMVTVIPLTRELLQSTPRGHGLARDFRLLETGWVARLEMRQTLPNDELEGRYVVAALMRLDSPVATTTVREDDE